MEERGNIDNLLNKLANPFVNVHTVQGIQGDIFQGRMLGFDHGDAEYVSFADDDDDINSDEYHKIVRYVYDNKPDALYTNSYKIVNGSTSKFYKHKEWNIELHKRLGLPVFQMVFVKRDIMNTVITEINRNDYSNEVKMGGDQLIFGYIAKMCGWEFKPDSFPYTFFYKDRPNNIIHDMEFIREKVKKMLA